MRVNLVEVTAWPAPTIWVKSDLVPRSWNALNLLSRARLPGTLENTVAFHAIKQSLLKHLTFKYNQVCTLVGGQVCFLAIKKALASCSDRFHLGLANASCHIRRGLLGS